MTSTHTSSFISPAIAAEASSHTDLLRLITCGSVDDGKSTLIGRLLHDTRCVHADQLAAIERASNARNLGTIDLSYLTDGLRAEREQGITIDVAYRYFTTERRRFILADTPGHVQYTRNMATGASTADAAVLLVDARQGVVEQTRRHACIASLLGIPNIIVAINKMDLVGFDPEVVENVRRAFSAFTLAARPAGGKSISDQVRIDYVPVSALHGDNIVDRSVRMPWHEGATLLQLLETLPPSLDRAAAHARFPVQYVLRARTDEHHDYRGYSGRIAAGTFAVGDEVIVLPSGVRSRIARIHTGRKELLSAVAPQSVAIVLADDIDASRGDMLIRASDAEHAEAPRVSLDHCADVIWMNQQPLIVGRRLLLKQCATTTHVLVAALAHRLDITTLATHVAPAGLGLNEIGRVRLRSATPLVTDPYSRIRATGAFVLIDPNTNATLGAGMIADDVGTLQVHELPHHASPL